GLRAVQLSVEDCGVSLVFFFQAEDGIRDFHVTGVQTCALPIFATAMFGMGCFWGAERLFWRLPGVWTTAVGYAGGYTPNPTYEEVCSGRTGHAEAVLVVFDPRETSLETMLKTFWEGHDPTQGMRQGNDVGTQYRSAAWWADEGQRALIEASRDAYAQALAAAGRGPITTELGPAPTFYYAEPYH